MSKLAQLLKMIKMLENEGKLKTSDIAVRLNVSDRMIRKYANDIKEAGLPIRSVSGPGGGYYFTKEK